MSKRRQPRPRLLFYFGSWVRKGTDRDAGACPCIQPQPEKPNMAKESKQLDELFHDTLKDIYYAEKKILSALPKMAKAAQNDALTTAFEKHQAETEEQISRLEQVFELIDQKP